MCGIVATIGPRPSAPLLLEALRQLEYRGYDSAGIATVSPRGLHCLRASGKLVNLSRKLEAATAAGVTGIGHTRWATHGSPEERNAHPQLDQSGQLAVVQNGIIENHRPLREQLEAEGVAFVSDTDTEVIPHLVARQIERLSSHVAPADLLLKAVQSTTDLLKGAYAIAVVWAARPGEVVAARWQAPLLVGLGEGEFFCASDTPAIATVARSAVSLEDGESVRLTPLGVELFDCDGNRIQRTPRRLEGGDQIADKRPYRHFMLKEIHEQGESTQRWLDRYLRGSRVELGLDPGLFEGLHGVEILACGTSRHAAMVGGHLLQQLAGIPTSVHYASEFRYAPPPLRPGILTIGVTQSGETADTLAAMAMEEERRLAADATELAPRLLGITNRPESSLGRRLPEILDIAAGVEVGVAATKTFMGQLLAFYGLALDLAARRHARSTEEIQGFTDQLKGFPPLLQALIEQHDQCCASLAQDFLHTEDMIYLGRGINYPIALEGALKLKEISYIHAEGYPAGEMKHGPIALLDAKVPVLSIATPGPVFEKVLSNVQEAKARNVPLIGVAPECQDAQLFDVLLPIPVVNELLSPLLTVIPMQLLSYHIAASKGLDVDQPRNLAKSVTVE